MATSAYGTAGRLAGPDRPARRPLRVAFVLSSLGAGGAERVIAKLSERLVMDGVEVTVIAFDRPEDPIFHQFDPRVAMVRLALPPVSGRGKALANAVRRLQRLRGALARGRFDVAISFLTKINALCLAASIGLPTPVIVSERNNPRLQPKHWLWDMLLKLLYPRAQSIVLLTDGSRVCLPERQRSRAVVIRNPAAAPPFESRGAQLMRCVGVGRLTHQKGFDLLIQAFARIAGRFPEWELIIWGDGPDRQQLQEQIARLGLHSRITLAGTTPQPGSWVEEATMLVLSSRYEGGPNVVIEALASGIPVIASRCDFGPAELIEDGRDGLLVPPEDSAALAEAMARMMSDAGLRAGLARSGQQRIAAEASLDTIMDQWRDVIRSATGLGGVVSTACPASAAASV